MNVLSGRCCTGTLLHPASVMYCYAERARLACETSQLVRGLGSWAVPGLPLAPRLFSFPFFSTAPSLFLSVFPGKTPNISVEIVNFLGPDEPSLRLFWGKNQQNRQQNRVLYAGLPIFSAIPDESCAWLPRKPFWAWLPTQTSPPCSRLPTRPFCFFSYTAPQTTEIAHGSP